MSKGSGGGGPLKFQVVVLERVSVAVTRRNVTLRAILPRVSFRATGAAAAAVRSCSANDVEQHDEQRLQQLGGRLRGVLLHRQDLLLQEALGEADGEQGSASSFSV